MISNNPPQSERVNVFQHYQAVKLLFSLVQRWKRKNWPRSCVINRTAKKKPCYSWECFFPSPYWIYFLETATSSMFGHIKPNSETNRKIWWPDEYKQLIKRRGKIAAHTASAHQHWPTICPQDVINMEFDNDYKSLFFQLSNTACLIGGSSFKCSL